jgi:hypothetical protein
MSSPQAYRAKSSINLAINASMLDKCVDAENWGRKRCKFTGMRGGPRPGHLGKGRSFGSVG